VAPTLPLFERFWQAARGRICMMTIAPELEGALEVIAEAARRGVCVSLDTQTPTLLRLNAESPPERGTLTHTFNAMRPLGHNTIRSSQSGILGVCSRMIA